MPDELVHESATCASPAVALTAGVETCGKNRKPALPPNVDDVEVPGANPAMMLWRPNDVDVDNPPENITGFCTVKLVEEKSYCK